MLNHMQIVVNSAEYMINLDHVENCEIVVNLIVKLTTTLIVTKKYLEAQEN